MGSSLALEAKSGSPIQLQYFPGMWLGPRNASASATAARFSLRRVRGRFQDGKVGKGTIQMEPGHESADRPSPWLRVTQLGLKAGHAWGGVALVAPGNVD